MKKFTISLLTAFTFSIISILSCFSVYADEIIIDEDEFVTIDVDEYWDWEDNSALSFGYSLQSNTDSFLFYDQLDANNKAAYDVMKLWLEPRTDTLTITLPEPVSYKTNSIDMSSWSEEQSDEFSDVVFSCIKDGKTALMLDYPELLWLDDNNIAVSLNYSTSYNFKKGTYTIKLKKIYITGSVCDIYENLQNAVESTNLLKEGIENIKVEGDDFYTKVKFIHDYISNAVTYNLDSPYYNTALGMFVEPYQFVCEGYAEAVKLLCDKENIPCISVIGNINPIQKTGHMWNYIQMEDGKWYGLDCTWDDLDDESDPIQYKYFLTGASSFLSSHKADDTYITPNFTYPELSETDYVYNQDQPIVTAITTGTATQTTTATTASSVSETSSKTTSTTVEASTVSTEPIILIKGDFNGDGILNISDAVLLKRKLLKLSDINKNDILYELNNDNKINIFDLVILLRKLTD